MCVHHWIIDPPNGDGGFSEGKCQKCHEVKQFANYITDGLTEGDSSAVRFNKNKAQRELHKQKLAAGVEARERTRGLRDDYYRF